MYTAGGYTTWKRLVDGSLFGRNVHSCVYHDEHHRSKYPISPIQPLSPMPVSACCGPSLSSLVPPAADGSPCHHFQAHNVSPPSSTAGQSLKINLLTFAPCSLWFAPNLGSIYSFPMIQVPRFANCDRQPPLPPRNRTVKGQGCRAQLCAATKSPLYSRNCTPRK